MTKDFRKGSENKGFLKCSKPEDLGENVFIKRRLTCCFLKNGRFSK
jgi:hypothetical protein